MQVGAEYKGTQQNGTLSLDWFLYNIGLRHERVKPINMDLTH